MGDVGWINLAEDMTSGGLLWTLSWTCRFHLHAGNFLTSWGTIS